MLVEPPPSHLPNGRTREDVSDRSVGLAPEALIALSAPATAGRDVRVAVSVAAAAAVVMMAVTSTGDVILLGVLLGLAAHDVVAGGVGILASMGVVARWGTSSLAALAGGQAVVGAAGWTGSTAAVASSWGAAAALILVCPPGLAPAAAFGATAAQIVAGPALGEGSSVVNIALRICAPLAGMVAASICARILPRSLARAGALGVAAVALALAST